MNGIFVAILPGLSVTPEAMLDSLERVAGAAVRARVRCDLDRRIMQIVCTWPGAFDFSRALRLGFSADRDIDSIVRQFMAEHRHGRRPNNSWVLRPLESSFTRA